MDFKKKSKVESKEDEKLGLDNTFNTRYSIEYVYI
jgi:hypothetical protein